MRNRVAIARKRSAPARRVISDHCNGSAPAHSEWLVRLENQRKECSKLSIRSEAQRHHRYRRRDGRWKAREGNGHFRKAPLAVELGKLFQAERLMREAGESDRCAAQFGAALIAKDDHGLLRAG